MTTNGNDKKMSMETPSWPHDWNCPMSDDELKELALEEHGYAKVYQRLIDEAYARLGALCYDLLPTATVEHYRGIGGNGNETDLIRNPNDDQRRVWAFISAMHQLERNHDL